MYHKRLCTNTYSIMALLDFTLKDSILHIQLNDPESRNAFSPTMADEFCSAFRSAGVKAVLLSSKGPVFCSGGNLRFYKNLKNKNEGLEYNKKIESILSEFANLKIPKAAWVNGPCFGGGIELLSCFDFIAASPSSLFGLWQRKVGLSFGWGGESRLNKKINSEKLRNWLLSADTRTVYQIRNLGLVDQIFPHSNGLLKSKDWLIRSLDLGDESLEKITQNSNSAFEALWMSEEHKKALSKIK